MDTKLETLVDRIFGHLLRLGSVIASRRRLGLNSDYIREAVNDLGLETPGDLVELYSHCDGTANYEGEVLGKIQFFPGFYWMSLGDVLEVYKAVSSGTEWNRSWLPLFANGGGDFYAVICDRASPYFGEIVGFVLGEPDQIVEFESISKMIETIERCFAEGVFSISEGGLKAHYPRMRAIARQVQSGFMEHDA